jgi:hypothetical protein
MALVRFAALALLAMPAISHAATPPASAVAKAAPVAPLALAPGMKRAAMSPEGRTIASRVYGTPDPRINEIKAQIAALGQQRMQLISAAPVDLEKLEPLLRQEELLQTELRARNNDRLMLFLRSLPEADRYPALQTMMNPVKPQSSAKPAPAN